MRNATGVDYFGMARDSDEGLGAQLRQYLRVAAMSQLRKRKVRAFRISLHNHQLSAWCRAGLLEAAAGPAQAPSLNRSEIRLNRRGHAG
jgi:hypothetical protein